MSETKRPLIEAFLDYAKLSIDEKGIYPHPMLTAPEDSPDAPITLTAMAMAGPAVVSLGLAKQSNASVVIFGLDRFTMPGQGIELPDFLSVFWWRRGTGWRFGVMAYRHAPRLVLPVDWSNPFWAARMAREVKFVTGIAPRLAS